MLRSVEAQVRLIALPVTPFAHTPFVTCMITEGVLALLSACSFIFKGKQLAIARDQIRMTVGCLKTLGELWPRTMRNVREIQAIARQVLSVGAGSRAASTNNGTPDSIDVPSLSSGQGDDSVLTEVDMLPDPLSSKDDTYLSIDSIDDLCGWYNPGDLSLDPSWWVNS